MSLLSLIREPEVRQRIDAVLVERPRRRPMAMLAPPLSTNYAIVGTAFDYLLRFALQRLNRDAHCTGWVAEAGFKVLSKRFASTHSVRVEDSEKSIDRRISKRGRIIEEAQGYLEEARELHRDFLAGVGPTDGLLKSTLRLAHLDIAYRNWEHFQIEAMRRIDSRDVTDLWNLISLADPAKFRASNACYLNPVFGPASSLVDGADADLVIDSRIIDIKTSKKDYISPETVRQLVGYYVLLRLGGITSKGTRYLDYHYHVSPIETLEVYLPRFAHLEVYSIRDLIKEAEFHPFVRWLIDYLVERQPSLALRAQSCKTRDARDWVQ